MIHLFNPENDLALGLGCRNYTPPPHAAALHRAGALLPLWWAGEKDAVIAPELYDRDIDKLHERFGLKGTIYSGGEGEPIPWGWSDDARRQFESAGLDKRNLPDDNAIANMRVLSHRATAIKILSMLGEEYTHGIQCFSADEAVALEESHPGCYFKSPWSGSGRGVFCASSLTPEALYRRAEGIIHRQGSVIVEPGLDKIMDFAILFYNDGIKVEYRGLSVFRTEPRGMYTGNIAAPQNLLADMIASQCDIEKVSDIISSLETILTIIIGTTYKGWMGVDMMVYRGKDGKPSIMPCIEFNLRMTMGVVAMAVTSRLSLTIPRMLSWHHAATPPEASTILLPPTSGFTLALSPIV